MRDMVALLVTVILAQPGPPESVYRVSLPVDIPVTVGASLGASLPYAFSGRLIRLKCPCNPNNVNGFDRPAIGNSSPAASVASYATTGAALVVPLVLDTLSLGFSPALFEDALVFVETLAINTALTTAAKFLVQRPLPVTYTGDPRFVESPGGYRSFFSTHVSLTFAALSAASMTIRLRYGEQIWPWIVTLVVGASVGYERVAAGRHFPTDVIAGGVLGAATGIIVPWLHARRDPERGGLVLLPGPDGVSVGWVGRF